MNKLKTIFLIFCTFIFGYAKKEHTNVERSNPIDLLVKRLLPTAKDVFVFNRLDSPDSQKDVFQIESSNGKIVISGDNYISMAVGLNYYLKNYCHTYISWYAADKIKFPEKFPVVPNKIQKTAKVNNRFFLNYCTFGYTMPWWKWNDWERFIDWMALNGVNLPLAITGQESIWYEVWKEYGMSDEQIRSYFTGPAHLPWHRMSNLDKWGGPLPKSWLEFQRDLQTKILKRERELGMKPVLPAFSGHVPEALKKVRPEAKISQLSSWGGFPDEYRSFFLDPLDPLFKEIQQKFLTKQTQLYGTNHFYGADPFNEVAPPSWEPEYLSTVSSTIYNSMKAVDPDATWLQMSWIFYFEHENWTNERIKAMLSAVPQDKMVLLDYYGENKEVWKMTDSFFGKPFIWCYLGNFGGNTMLAGNIDEVEARIENAFSQNKNMWGIGSTLEAFDVNPLMYEFVFDKVWSDGKTNVTQWIQKWADLRYGNIEETNRKAWEILHRKIYKTPAKLGQATLTNARPSLTGSGNWTTDSTIDYDNKDLFRAWELLLKNPSYTSSYQYDIVNVGRQVLGNHFTVLRNDFTQNYESKDLVKMKENSAKMLELLDDMERLLATHSSFLAGKWINDAKILGGKNAQEQNYYQHNAKNIITTWGMGAQSLNDYANRSWAGLTKGFYKKRWEMFINDVMASVQQNKTFDEKAFNEKVTKFEWGWTQSYETYNARPKGNAVKIATELINKYKVYFY